MWTKFFDMSSGGFEKLDESIIYIEAEEDKAIEVFRNMFKRDPFNVTCSCCGPDYSVYEVEEIDDEGLRISKKDIATFYE